MNRHEVPPVLGAKNCNPFIRKHTARCEKDTASKIVYFHQTGVFLADFILLQGRSIFGNATHIRSYIVISHYSAARPSGSRYANEERLTGAHKQSGAAALKQAGTRPIHHISGHGWRQINFAEIITGQFRPWNRVGDNPCLPTSRITGGEHAAPCKGEQQRKTRRRFGIIGHLRDVARSPRRADSTPNHRHCIGIGLPACSPSSASPAYCP